MKTITHSVEETRLLARKLARKIRHGDVIGLTGELGAGKTVFVQALAEAFGISGPVQSPTFIIMNVYPIKKYTVRTFVHVDCYRIDDTNELSHIGLSDYLEDPNSLVVIEWADKIRNILPKKMTWISIAIEGDARAITVKG